MKKKTISGARAKQGQRSNGCNPQHNNRDYLPSNADPERQHLNEFWVESTKSVTIDQIYDKLFQPAYDEWLEKEHAKGRQKDAPEKYIDKIRNSPKSKNQKREQYEIIWQIGDMKNTGWDSDRDDFEKARLLLIDFAKHLQELPEVTFVDKERLGDPSWKPPFNSGLVITNLTLHGDENTPQIHMDFIPYAAGCRRGQKVQNAYAAAFEGMGYSVEQEQARDEGTGELIWKQNKDGDFVLDKNGQKIPVMKKISFGSIDWIEEQKGWIQERMMEEYSWEREYKGRNKFGDVTLSDYIVEDNARTIREQEQRRQDLSDQIEEARKLKNEIATEAGNMLAVYRDAKDVTAQALDRKEEIEQELAIIEEVRKDPNGIYDNVHYLVGNCSDDFLERLDRRGREMRERDLQQNLFESDLNRQIEAAEQSPENQQKVWDRWKQLSSDYHKKKRYRRWDPKCNDAARSYYDAQYILDTTHNIFVAAYALLKMVFYGLRKESEEIDSWFRTMEKLIQAIKEKMDEDYYEYDQMMAAYECSYLDEFSEYMKEVDDVVGKVDAAENRYRERNRQVRSESRAF